MSVKFVSCHSSNHVRLKWPSRLLCFCFIAAFALTLGTTDRLRAQLVFDLSADFSDGGSGGTNPSALGWSYFQDQAGSLGSWSGYSTGDFTAAVGLQNGWTNPGANHLGWSQMVGTTFPNNRGPFDVEAGDVISHGATTVAWTADAATAGNYLIDLSAWSIRGGGNAVSLAKNSSVLASVGFNDGSTSRSLSTGSGTGPLEIAPGLIVSLAAGDSIQANVLGGDYAAINFTLTQTEDDPPPPPEPSTEGTYAVHNSTDEFSAGLSNPSGGPGAGWGYNGGGDGAGPIGPWSPSGYSNGDFGTTPGEDSWNPSHNAWALINNAGNYGAAADAFNLTNGDLVTHGPSSLAWQAVAGSAGLYNIDVTVKPIRDGRAHSFALTFNDDGANPLWTGTIDCVGGTCDASTNLVMPTLTQNFAAGEYIRLKVDGNDYAAVSVTVTPVPEPSSIALALFAVVGLVGRRRRPCRT